ncbi:MAG: hypothetical protein GX025_10715 [Clostridiales bacterium]|nr:hypothetical protein [Clostridiales bacterium]
MKVINRSDGNVTYHLEELRTRRVFTPNESKEIEPAEMEALFQMDGGAELIKHYLLVDDKAWVEDHWQPEEEYFWKYADIEHCLKEDSLELFSETLDYAPQGVLDLIKAISWKLPLTDLNKIDEIRNKLGFDVQGAVRIMESQIHRDVEPKKERLRKRKES